MRFVVIERVGKSEGIEAVFVDMIVVPNDFDVDILNQRFDEMAKDGKPDSEFRATETDIDAFAGVDEVIAYMQSIGDFDEDGAPGTCPECGSDDIEKKTVDVSGVGSVPAQVCGQCGHAVPIAAETEIKMTDTDKPE